MLIERLKTRPAFAGLVLFPYLLLSIAAHALIFFVLKPGGVATYTDTDSAARFLSARLVQQASPAPPAVTPPDSADSIPSTARVVETPIPEIRREPEVLKEKRPPTLTSDPVPAPEENTERGRTPEGNLAMPDPDPLRYRTMAELDLPPYLRGELPDDPPELQSRQESGTLVLEVWIDETGSVTKTAVVRSNLPPIFAEASVTMLAEARYVPAKKGGVDVRSRIVIEMHYAPPPGSPSIPVVRPIGKGFR